MRNPDLEAQARFLNKYGRILVFQDGDDVFTVHPTKMYFCEKCGNSHWMLFCCKEGYNPDQEFEDDFDCFNMDQDFNGLVGCMRVGLPLSGIQDCRQGLGGIQNHAIKADCRVSATCIPSIHSTHNSVDNSFSRS
jgi:hypothetical protein